MDCQSILEQINLDYIGESNITGEIWISWLYNKELELAVQESDASKRGKKNEKWIVEDCVY